MRSTLILHIRKYYAESLRAGGLPRPDGRTQEQWRTVLNQARDTLKDPQKRTEHIASLQTDLSQVGFPTLESEKFASPEGDISNPLSPRKHGAHSSWRVQNWKQ